MWKPFAGRGWIDGRLPLGGDLVLRLIEHPGRSLDDTAQRRLVADLRGVADRCSTAQALRYGILSGEPERLRDAILACAYRRDTGEMVGFNAMVALELTVGGRPTRVVHAGLCMVDPALRSRGLCLVLTASPAVVAFVRNRLAPLWFTNVTQVPAVAGVFTSALEDVFPAPGRSTPPSRGHTDIAREMMGRHRAAFGVGADADFDADRFVIRNAYTGGSDGLKKSFAACQKHRSASYNEWCRALLDYERGDDVIQVGRMTLAQAGRVALRLMRGMAASGRPGRRHARPVRDLAAQGRRGS